MLVAVRVSSLSFWPHPFGIAVEQPRPLAAALAEPARLKRVLERQAACRSRRRPSCPPGPRWCPSPRPTSAPGTTSPPCTTHRQSMSCRWPFSQAQTKRIGVTSDLLAVVEDELAPAPGGRGPANAPAAGVAPACRRPSTSRPARRRTRSGTPARRRRSAACPACSSADRRRAQRQALRLLEPALLLEKLLQAHGQARLGNGRERVALHVPLLEAADDDRARRQVDHRARTEGRDELAQALRVLGHARSSALAIVSPRGSRRLQRHARLDVAHRAARHEARDAPRSGLRSPVRAACAAADAGFSCCA